MKINNKTPFTIIPTEILKTENLTPHQKIILAILISYTDNNGVCYPSYQTIAKNVNCSKKTVINQIKILEEKGYISKTKSEFHSTNTMKINYFNSKSDTPTVETVTLPSEINAPEHSELNSSPGETDSPKLYSFNYNNNSNHIDLSIIEENELDEIIKNANLDILDLQTDIDLFEKAITKMYNDEFITVKGIKIFNATVRKYLRKINSEIMVTAFDQYCKSIPKNPVNYLISILYNELNSYEVLKLQYERGEVV